jgi:hypothetical protein
MNEIVEKTLAEETVKAVEEQMEVSGQKKIEKKEKKHLKALRLVNEARQMVDEADKQAQACKLLLVDDLQEYEEAKISLKQGGYDACVRLLENLGYENKIHQKQVNSKVTVFEPKEELTPMQIKNVSSGKFTGLMLSLFAGTITTVGLIYMATEKLGITLDLSKLPSVEVRESILSWFSEAVGLESNVMVGAGILGLSTLSVVAIVYALRVGLKGSKNLHFAVKQFVEAELYTEKKADCKAEMDKVDAHMKETVSTLKMYEVLLNEQKGKLERILHIEGAKSKSTEYHEKSYAEIRETKALIREMQNFMALSMSKEGRLSQESVDALSKAKKQIDRMLERLY